MKKLSRSSRSKRRSSSRYKRKLKGGIPKNPYRLLTDLEKYQKKVWSKIDQFIIDYRGGDIKEIKKRDIIYQFRINDDNLGIIDVQVIITIDDRILITAADKTNMKQEIYNLYTHPDKIICEMQNVILSLFDLN